MLSSITFSASTANSKATNQSIYTRSQKQKISITQTYFLAHSARGKLLREAARPNLDLRLLVGHANLLDSLMLDLTNTEQEQERRFNNIVSGSEEEEQEGPTQLETVVEEPEHKWEAQDTASSDKELEDETEQGLKPKFSAVKIDSDIEDDEEENNDLTLVRTALRHPPPKLSFDTDLNLKDEQMPPSPPTTTIKVLSEKQRQTH
jgi:hypothetical protein